MIIVPISHDQLTVSRLPFATIGIIALCIVIYFPASSRMTRDAERETNALSAVEGYYLQHGYLSIPEKTVDDFPKRLKAAYEARQSWVKWYRESPGEVEEFLKSSPNQGGARGGGPNPYVDLLEDMRGLPGGAVLDVSAIAKELGSGDSDKAYLLSSLKSKNSIAIDDEQKEFDLLLQNYDNAKRKALLNRFAYTPSRPRFLNLITHQFLHSGIVHIVFNMLILWLVGVKLEDIWGRPIFVSLYLTAGAIGAIFHGMASSDSQVPLIGASGAVAGLMGAFAVRLSRTKIQFFYAYWLFRLMPKVGTFEAPAYLMLPFWFIGELFFALFFNLGSIGSIAYWSHVGGFIVGVTAAFAFKLTKFEEKVLGREPEVAVDPDEMPLVAFQRPPQVLTVVDLEPKTQEVEKTAPASVSKKQVRLNLKKLSITAVSKAGVDGKTSYNAPVSLSSSEVAFIAAGRIDHVESKASLEIFGDDAPRNEPAYLLALVQQRKVGPYTDFFPGYMVDGEKLSYTQLLRPVFPSRQKNFAALIKLLIMIYPDAVYIHGAGSTSENNLPIYADIDNFLGHIRRRVAAGQKNTESK